MIGKILEITDKTVRGIKARLVKTNLGGGLIKELQHYATAGDDSSPLPGDYSMCVPTAQSGVPAIVGYADPQSPQVAAPGEKFIYGRDSSGVIVNRVHLKNDGEVLISNDNADITIDAAGGIAVSNSVGSVTIADDGEIEINNGGTVINATAAGVVTMLVTTLTITGNVAITGTLFNNGQNVGSTHGHAQAPDSGGDTQVNIAGVL